MSWGELFQAMAEAHRIEPVVPGVTWHIKEPENRLMPICGDRGDWHRVELPPMGAREDLCEACLAEARRRGWTG